MNQCGSSHKTKSLDMQLPEISINGTVVPEYELAQELQYHQDENFEKVVQQSAQAIVIRYLLLEEAKKLNIDNKNLNEEEILQAVISQGVNITEPTKESCQRYYQNNTAKFKTAPLLEVDHILLAAPKDDFAARELAKTNALNIIAELKKNISLFPTLASQYSSCPSKTTGGSLGQISKGQTVAEFEKQLLLSPKGLVQEPIESRYGYHVVNLVRKIEGKQLEYPMVEDKIINYLTHRASNLAIQSYLQNLVEQSTIVGVDLCFTDENIFMG